MWAGVQKASRPTVLCQEMSQINPTAMLVAASANKNPGQAVGELATRSAGLAAGTAWADAEIPSIIGAVMSPVADGVQLNQRLVAVGQFLLEGGKQLFVLLGEGQLGNVDIYPPIPECEVIVHVAHAGRRIGDFYELVFFLHLDGRFVNERILAGLGPVVVEHV